MYRNFTPSKEKRQEIAGTLDARTKGGGFPGTDGAINGHVVAYGGNNMSGSIDISTALNAHGSGRIDIESETFIIQSTVFDIAQLTSPTNRSSYKPGTCPTITKSGSMMLQNQKSVRRLTPLECERLQGFPDNYTNIPRASDTARYRAIGNSMAVPVMKWIGERIEMVDKILST
jgi:DNA (cytosine-5)-methyltransferase 1